MKQLFIMIALVLCLAALGAWGCASSGGTSTGSTTTGGTTAPASGTPEKAPATPPPSGGGTDSIPK